MNLALVDTFARPDGVYLLSHSIGLPPASVEALVLDQFIDSWAADPAGAWPRWLSEIAGFRGELGRLLNSAPRWFCPQTNVSSAATKIIHSLPVDPARPTILISERAFPSLGFVAQAASRRGFRTRLIPHRSDTSDPATWRDALRPDVAIVIASHAESDTGRRLPVRTITGLARTNGTHSIIDIAQSAGILPIDLTAWNADFVIGSCVKWLCGGPGAGYLWTNPTVIDLCSPADVGCFSHRDPFEFDINHFRLADDALRFWGGTPSPLPAAIARHGLATLNGIGIPAIRAHNAALIDELVDRVDPALLVSPTDPDRRSGTVIVSRGDDTDQLFACFRRANIHVDRRDGGIRISPHLYNTGDDIDAVVAVLRERRAS